MGDFDDYAASARSAHDAKQAEHDAQLKSAHDERMANWERGRKFLIEEALPVVLEARQAFVRQGILVDPVDNWTATGLFTDPQISAKFSGQKKRPDGTTYSLNGPSVVIIHNGIRLSVGVSDNQHGAIRAGKFQSNDLSGVADGLKMALAKMFDQLDPTKT